MKKICLELNMFISSYPNYIFVPFTSTLCLLYFVVNSVSDETILSYLQLLEICFVYLRIVNNNSE